jgi:hypothetical protein
MTFLRIDIMNMITGQHREQPTEWGPENRLEGESYPSPSRFFWYWRGGIAELGGGFKNIV